MTKSEFLELMKFPPEWESLGMIPEELSKLQLANYKPGHEDASEHDRNGAFHWWLKQDPSEIVLKKLMYLASIDPESLMGYDVRSYIEKASCYSEAVGLVWGERNVLLESLHDEGDTEY